MCPGQGSGRDGRMKGRSRADLLNAASRSGKHQEKCQKKKLLSFPAFAPCKQRLSAPGSGGSAAGCAGQGCGGGTAQTLFPMTCHLCTGRLGPVGYAEIPLDFGQPVGCAEIPLDFGQPGRAGGAVLGALVREVPH